MDTLVIRKSSQNTDEDIKTLSTVTSTSNVEENLCKKRRLNLLVKGMMKIKIWILHLLYGR